MISAIHTSNVMNVVPSVMSQRRYNAQSGAAKTSVKRADPLSLERIDIQLEVTPVPVKELNRAAEGESSAAIRERVVRARAIQTERFKAESGVHCNAPTHTSARTPPPTDKRKEPGAIALRKAQRLVAARWPFCVPSAMARGAQPGVGGSKERAYGAGQIACVTFVARLFHFSSPIASPSYHNSVTFMAQFVLPE